MIFQSTYTATKSIHTTGPNRFILVEGDVGDFSTQKHYIQVSHPSRFIITRNPQKMSKTEKITLGQSFLYVRHSPIGNCEWPLFFLRKTLSN